MALFTAWNWRDVKDYLVDNLVRSNLYNFDYKEAYRTVGVYYSTFNELRLPPASTEDDSESEEELQSMIQTHYLWLPYHYTHPGDNNPPRTHYLALIIGRNDLQLSTWKGTTSKVYQHLHLHEHPLQALNYVISMVYNSMSTTVAPVNERLHLVAVNLYLETVLQRNLLHDYKRDGSDYMELENHSDALGDMTKFTTSTVIISGCTYDYIIQMMTPHFHANHLIDTTVVSGPDYVDTTSVKNTYHRNYDKTT